MNTTRKVIPAHNELHVVEFTRERDGGSAFRLVHSMLLCETAQKLVAEDSSSVEVQS